MKLIIHTTMRSLSTVSIYLIFTYSVVLANQFANTYPQLPVDGHKRTYSSDFDELRISNNQLAVGRSTNISSNVRPSGGGSDGGAGTGWSDPTGAFLGEGGIEQRVTNHIGKPLVPLSVQVASKSHPPPPPYHTQSYPQQQQQQPASSQGGSSSSLRAAASSNIAQQQQQQQQQYGNAVCNWMSLREFKKVTLATNELILRDHEDRASYILAMKAFIKWTDDDYFPLNNMKALPFVDHIPLLEVPHDGASAHDPRNCSFIAATMADRLAGGGGGGSDGGFGGVGATRLYLVRDDPIRFFEEHIKIVVDCGYYLILHIQGDGYHLILKSISFYQNPAAKQRNRQAHAMSGDIGRIDQDPEGLVFTTKGTKNSPLLTMPLTSRYICQKRIVLTGNNSIQLVLETFELQRLVGRLLELPTSDPSLTSYTTVDKTTSMNKDDMDVGGPSLFHHYPSINRHRRDTLKYYDIPLCPLNTSVTFVERCPEPSSRMAPLNSMMMNATIMQRKNHPKGKFFADKWTVLKSIQPNGSSARISSSLTTMYFILACLFVRTLTGVLPAFTGHID